MPDFTAPEYASYVALCKELRLRPEGEWSLGDWVAYGSIVEQLDSRHALDSYEVPKDAVWLPQLADWLEILETAGGGYNGRGDIAFVRQPTDPDSYMAATASLLAAGPYAIARTREEAAARLFMAYTGK